MFRKLFCERNTATGSRVDCIIDGDLSIFMVEPGVDVLATLLQYFLSQHDRRRRSVRVEVIFRYLASPTNSGTTIVP